jgi:general secretion pathway protein D
MVSLNFNRADLVEIIHIIAQHLGLTYTIDPDVKGTVTINSAQPLRSEDLLPIFHQILRMNGAVAVRTGNLYHIMPIKEGKGLARPVGEGKEDSYALQIVPVRFFSVTEMKKVLTPFLQPGGEIVENPRGNFLIIMDLPSNIQRLTEIADLIDVQVFAGTRMEIYQPKVASAEELAQEMTKVMQSFASSAPQTETFTAQFIPLPRINQLLVISHSEAAWTYAKRWLDRIDIVAEGPGRRIFIYPVENGKATELADVLNQALGQPSAGRREPSRTLEEFHRSMPSSTGQFGAGRPTTSGFAPSGMSTPQSPPLGSSYAAVPLPGQPPIAPTAPPVQPGAAPAPAIPRAPTPPTAKPEEQLRIVPDPATNSLVIYGTAQEFQNIKNILKDLDAIPRQVLIDALVLQVDLNNAENFGVDYEFMRRFGDVKIFDQTFNSKGQLLSGALAAFAKSGGVSAVVGSEAVRAFITAVMKDSRIKLLSSPSVLASDNRPARIQVGAQEPIPTGTVQSPVSGGTITSSTTVQYLNTGRILTIIPQVNSMGLVNLQIKAEVSARGDNVQVGQDTFPSFNTQDAETTAVVQDGETLVIGGLIGENKTKSRTGIPYLMDLPVLGRLFGTTTEESNRTELIMLITPHVIRNRTEAQSVTEAFKKSLSTVRNELERITREKEKLQSTPQPEPKTPAPGPSTDQPVKPPAPAPSAAPSGPGASAVPLRKIGLSSTGSPSPSDQQDSPSPAHPEAVNAAPMEARPAPASPAYALSATKYTQTPASAKENPVKAGIDVKSAQQWVVQVAAMARKSDAEELARVLLAKGYEAYVMTAEVNAKTWHRVRVGQGSGLADAFALQKLLKDSEKFNSAFVTSR